MKQKGIGSLGGEPMKKTAYKSTLSNVINFSVAHKTNSTPKFWRMLT